MVKRVSFGILITCAILCLGAGIGIGYGIESGQVRSLDSDLEEKDLQIKELHSELSTLRAELDSSKSAYDLLRMDFDHTSNELDLLRINYNALTDYYQTSQSNYKNLQEDYEALQNACDGPTATEILNLRSQITSLQSQNSWLQAEVARLQNQLTVAPDHALERSEVWGNPKFSSTAWAGQDYQLRTTLQEIGEQYHQIHTYIEGETDCNDMAIDLWNILLTQNIKSVIVVGDRDKLGETFEECDHAWLYVFDAEGKVIYLEPTTGAIIYGRLSDNTINPEAEPFREGFIFEKPSDLWADICPTAHNW